MSQDQVAQSHILPSATGVSPCRHPEARLRHTVFAETQRRGISCEEVAATVRQEGRRTKEKGPGRKTAAQKPNETKENGARTKDRGAHPSIATTG
ncbi:hypothetical protein [Pedobacter sp. SYP-B3415]|uniref:hypothetical protein n=1 Tax=Pedobacter sp. SYP-B3415 TaxID=2496641 RepID=UPI00101CE0E6|nr:hypothetical protein [Pedobacter sp. SYP-B3415]